MSRGGAGERITVGVGAVIWNDQGEVLLVNRANTPRQHEWSLPGGRVEFGETIKAALVREIWEETGLAIEITGLLDVTELIDEAHYVLVDFTARALPGKPVAGSDARDARWFSPSEIAKLELWSETRRVINLSAKLPPIRKAVP